MRYHLAYNCGVVQNARFLALSQHLVEVALVCGQSVAAHEVGAQGWRFFFAHGRKLRLVADKHQSAVASGVYKLYEIVEQTARTEHRSLQSFVCNHRRLVDHKERVGVHVGCKREVAFERLLSVDAAVYGRCWRVGVDGEHFGSSSGRCKQHYTLLKLQHSAHYSTRQRCLTRSG